MPYIIDNYHLPYVLLYRSFVPFRIWYNGAIGIRKHTNWKNFVKISEQNDEREG